MNTNRPATRSQSGENHRDESAAAGPTREGVRQQIAAAILLALILLGLPTLVANMLNDFKLSAPDSLGASLGLIFKPGTVAYLVVIGLFVFRKKLPLWVISTMTVSMLMLVGFNSLLDLGFIGSGMLYFLIACALGALFFDGWRAFVPSIGRHCAWRMAVGERRPHVLLRPGRIRHLAEHLCGAHGDHLLLPGDHRRQHPPDERLPRRGAARPDPPERRPA
jgi:hypothetical protein